MRFAVFHFVPIAFFPGVWPHPLDHPIQTLTHTQEVPSQPFLLEFPQPFLAERCCTSFTLLELSVRPTLTALCLCWVKEPRPGHSCPAVTHQRSVQRQDHLSWPAGLTFINALQDAIDLLGPREILLAHGKPVVLQSSPWSFSTELPSNRSLPARAGAQSCSSPGAEPAHAFAEIL